MVPSRIGPPAPAMKVMASHKNRIQPQELASSSKGTLTTSGTMSASSQTMMSSAGSNTCGGAAAAWQAIRPGALPYEGHMPGQGLGAASAYHMETLKDQIVYQGTAVYPIIKYEDCLGLL